MGRDGLYGDIFQHFGLHHLLLGAAIYGSVAGISGQLFSNGHRNRARECFSWRTAFGASASGGRLRADRRLHDGTKRGITRSLGTPKAQLISRPSSAAAFAPKEKGEESFSRLWSNMPVLITVATE